MRRIERIERIERIVLPLISVAVVTLFWHAAVVLSHTRIFPSPAAVVRAIGVLATRSLLWRYIFDSLTRAVTGFVGGAIVGIPLGILLGWYRQLGRAMNPVVQMLRPISPIAWMPLTVIWFGVSNAAPIFLIFLATLFPIVVTSMNAVRNLPPVYTQAARNFGLSGPRLLLRVVLPAVLPRLIVGLRIAFGIAWLVLVAAEMIAVDSGLGYLIIDARNAGKRYDLVIAGMLLIGSIGLLLDLLIRRAERLPSVRWAFND